MTIEFRKENQMAIITINRPDRMNALDNSALNELSECLTEFDVSDELRAGIITGTGNQAFCSGYDFAEFSPDRPPSHEPVQIINPVFQLDINKPLIAAVNGAALGGGLELMLMCDLRVASEQAIFGFPEVKWGYMPAWGGTQRLPREIGRCQASEMLLTGNPINARHAFNIGLINRISPADQVLSSAFKLADEVCAAAPLAVRAAKEAVLKGLQIDYEEGLQLENALSGYLKTTLDFIEGIDAFRSKRKPHFKGK